MKISIITPSFNSADTIERAIKSVLAQKASNFEHIVVDGGSSDHTLDILRRYPHLKWISEPDRGQVHAMNKGFVLSTGEVIGYLNADDYYHDGAFAAVLPHFKRGAEAVMGKVLVRTEKREGRVEWLCDPATDFPAVLRHWEPNAFCVNPVGYFYRRAVQEKIPLREETGAKHDLEFLMELSLRCRIKKISAVLGIFNHDLDTQTGREQLRPCYWQVDNFPFVERLAQHLPEAEHKRFMLDRERGYQWRRHRTVKEAFALGMAKELFDSGEVFKIPGDVEESRNTRCGFVEHDRFATRGDWIIPIFTKGKVGSRSIMKTLGEQPPEILPASIYNVHFMDYKYINKVLEKGGDYGAHWPIALSLSAIFGKHRHDLQWKFIAGVREPVSRELSSFYQNNPSADVDPEEIVSYLHRMLNAYKMALVNHYKRLTGINFFDYPFDHNKKYQIITRDNISILIYRLEDLPRIFTAAMEEYLGVPGLELERVNISTEKKYAQPYREAKNVIRLDQNFLDVIYSSEFFRHYYTEKEIESFYHRWAK